MAITDLIVEEVCRDILSWTEKGESDLIISINITSQHITNRKLIQKLVEKITAEDVWDQGQYGSFRDIFLEDRLIKAILKECFWKTKSKMGVKL